MSTRSYIAIENHDGTVSFAYCHSDGYLMGVGKDVCVLSRAQARELIAQGDMSSVGDHYTHTNEDRRSAEPNPVRCVNSMDAFLNRAFPGSWCEYAYIINRSGTWNYVTSSDRTPRSLKRALKFEQTENARRAAGLLSGTVQIHREKG